MFTDQLAPNLADPLQAPPPGPSPFDDEPVASVPPMWRADRAKHIPAAGKDEYGIPGASASVYVAAFGGTALAGGLFPLAIFAVAAVFSGGRGPSLGELGAFAIGAFLIGILIAGSAGACIFPLVALVQYLAGLFRWRATMATLAGGWTGFASVAALGMGTREAAWWSPIFLIYGVVAVLMGQLGAAWAARKAVRSQVASRRWREPPAGARFTLRQLLGLTAGVAIVAAILSALRLPTGTWMAMGIATAVQAATLGAYLLIKQLRARLNANP